MAVFDDMEPERKVTVYDKGAVMIPDGTISTHTGDITIPEISRAEPLRLECSHFLEAVATGEQPRANVDEGLAVVEVLEAMQTSLERGGETITLTVDDDVGRRRSARLTLASDAVSAATSPSAPT